MSGHWGRAVTVTRDQASRDRAPRLDSEFAFEPGPAQFRTRVSSMPVILRLSGCPSRLRVGLSRRLELELGSARFRVRVRTRVTGTSSPWQQGCRAATKFTRFIQSCLLGQEPPDTGIGQLFICTRAALLLWVSLGYVIHVPCGPAPGPIGQGPNYPGTTRLSVRKLSNGQSPGPAAAAPSTSALCMLRLAG